MIFHFFLLKLKILRKFRKNREKMMKNADALMNFNLTDVSWLRGEAKCQLAVCKESRDNILKNREKFLSNRENQGKYREFQF